MPPKIVHGVHGCELLCVVRVPGVLVVVTIRHRPHCELTLSELRHWNRRIELKVNFNVLIALIFAEH